MNPRLFFVAAVALLAATLASRDAGALAVGQETSVTVIDIGGFSGNETLIDFEGIEVNEPVRDQFAGLGVTFGAGVFGDPRPDTSIQGNRELTNFDNDVNITNPLSFSFETPVNRVGFNVAQTRSGPSSVGVEALLGGTTVFSRSVRIGTTRLQNGTLDSVFAGFEFPSGFDEVRVTGTTVIEVQDTTFEGALSVDDLRFENVTPIPVPGSLLLLGSGLMGLAAAARYRRLS